MFCFLSKAKKKQSFCRHSLLVLLQYYYWSQHVRLLINKILVGDNLWAELEAQKYAEFVHICYCFNRIWSNSLNVFVTWENCQYSIRRNENTRTIKRNVQKLQSTYIIFLALKLSSLNSYLSRQCISNHQFFPWPAVFKLTDKWLCRLYHHYIFKNASGHPPKQQGTTFQIHWNDTHYSVFLW